MLWGLHVFLHFADDKKEASDLSSEEDKMSNKLVLEHKHPQIWKSHFDCGIISNSYISEQVYLSLISL